MTDEIQKLKKQIKELERKVQSLESNLNLIIQKFPDILNEIELEKRESVNHPPDMIYKSRNIFKRWLPK
jgi:hypothetical protein